MDRIAIDVDGEQLMIQRGQRTADLSDGRRVKLSWGETCPESYLGHYSETMQERDARRLAEQPGRYEVYTSGVVGGIAAVGTFATCLQAYHGLAARLPEGTALYIRRRFRAGDGEVEVRLGLDGAIAPTGGQQAKVRRALRDADATLLAIDEIADIARLPYDVTAAALHTLIACGDVSSDGCYHLTAQGRERAIVVRYIEDAICRIVAVGGALG